MGAQSLFYQKLELTQSCSFDKVGIVNKKTAIIIYLASILFSIPVLAMDSTSKAAPIRPTFQKTDVNLQFKMQQFEQMKLAEASKSAMFRQKLEDFKLKIASHEAEVKAKIQAFKDKQKAEVASRVNTNLNKINQNQTDQMLKYLDTMSSILDKLTNRINSNSPDIKDPTAATRAVSDARANVDAARTAVQAQAQKDYTIAVTTETKIRLDAQSKRDELHKDILAVRKMVIDAKQKVADAIRIAKSGKTATPSAAVKEGTTSGQQ